MPINFPITIKVFTEPESTDASFIAYIPEFDISSCGNTEQKAVDNVKEALEGVLEEVKSQNKLDEYLKEVGISSKKPFTFPKIIIESFNFNI